MKEELKQEIANLFNENLGSKFTPALATGLFSLVVATIEKYEEKEKTPKKEGK